MDAKGDEEHTGRRERGEALDEFPLVPTEILEGLPDAVVAAARDGRIVFVNALVGRLFGYPPEELVGRPVHLLWPERLRERYRRNIQLYFATDHPLRYSSEVWGLRRDGSEFVGEMSWGIVGTSAGPILLAVGRDVSQRRAAEARLRAVAAMGGRALAGATSGQLAADAVNLMRTALPISGAEVRLLSGDVLASYGPPVAASTHLPIGAGDELLFAPEREFDDEEMRLVHAVRDILATALARLRGEEHMRHEAVHDPLTGLANRTLLRDRLTQAIARSRREGGETGVLFVDLDNFKQVNDIGGHATGDAVLVELSGRMGRAVRPGDTVARLGGDEFVVVCEEVDQESALAVGERLEEAIRLPLTASGVKHGLSASIGVALGHSDPDALLGNADAAVYRAKAAGRGGIEVFHEHRGLQ
jgi:diguanylate cyclase (GGDEF)-like protein/PAS domain S-box-containing protein